MNKNTILLIAAGVAAYLIWRKFSKPSSGAGRLGASGGGRRTGTYFGDTAGLFTSADLLERTTPAQSKLIREQERQAAAAERAARQARYKAAAEKERRDAKPDPHFGIAGPMLPRLQQQGTPEGSSGMGFERRGWMRQPDGSSSTSIGLPRLQQPGIPEGQVGMSLGPVPLLPRLAEPSQMASLLKSQPSRSAAPAVEQLAVEAGQTEGQSMTAQGTRQFGSDSWGSDVGTSMERAF